MLSPLGLSAFCLLGALSTDNDTPERASRPFDATRNDLVFEVSRAYYTVNKARQFALTATASVATRPTGQDGTRTQLEACLGGGKSDASMLSAPHRARN